MKILVCGGRDYIDEKSIYDVLDNINSKHGVSSLCHGDCRGTDTIAKSWAWKREIPQASYPADWTKHGSRAGYIRNVEMLTCFKPDLVVAFPGGAGTKMMKNLAKTYYVQVYEVKFPTPQTKTE